MHIVVRDFQFLVIFSLADKSMWMARVLIFFGMDSIFKCKSASSMLGEMGVGVNLEISLKIWFK